MSTKNRENTKNIIIFISVLMILVVFFIFMGFTDYSEGRIPVIATAVEVRYHDETKWYAKYTVNGKSYKSCVHGAYIGLSNGRIITVYYDPDDPSEIWHNPDKGMTIVGVSIFVGIFVSVFVWSKIYSKKQQKNLQRYQNPYEHTFDSNYTHYSHNHNDINNF